MRILSISTHDFDSGAGRAAYRMHHGLLKFGIESHMLVQQQSKKESNIHSLDGLSQNFFNKLRPRLDKIPTQRYKNKSKELFSTSWIANPKILATINAINPDLVHIHWVCGGFLKIEDFTKIKFPICFSLHDYWIFTGGCHYMYNCNNYELSCGECPSLSSKNANDLSHKNWARKDRVFKSMNDFKLIAPSNWTKEKAKASSLLKNKHIEVVPNIINTSNYHPRNKEECRKVWNLPSDKKLILFGALDAKADLRKGYDLLRTSINKIKDENAAVIIFGANDNEISNEFNLPTYAVGRQFEENNMITLYNSADVMIVPSREETFGQTALEALACGVPVVGFAYSGLLDIVDHKSNGYLANPYDCDDLKNGINWILNNGNYQSLCESAIHKVKSNFEESKVIPKLLEFYKAILDK